MTKIIMCMVMKCSAAPCHLHLDFTTWQLVIPHSSSCGQTVSVMWVSYKRLWLVYLTLYEWYDRLSDNVSSGFLWALLYCSATIWQCRLMLWHYVKHLCDEGMEMFSMLMSLYNVYTQDVKTHTVNDDQYTCIIFVFLSKRSCIIQIEKKNNASVCCSDPLCPWHQTVCILLY